MNENQKNSNESGSHLLPDPTALPNRGFLLRALCIAAAALILLFSVVLIIIAFTVNEA